MTTSSGMRTSGLRDVQPLLGVVSEFPGRQEPCGSAHRASAYRLQLTESASGAAAKLAKSTARGYAPSVISGRSRRAGGSATSSSGGSLTPPSAESASSRLRGRTTEPARRAAISRASTRRGRIEVVEIPCLVTAERQVTGQGLVPPRGERLIPAIGATAAFAFAMAFSIIGSLIRLAF